MALVVAVGVGRIGTQTSGPRASSAAEVAEARANVELAFSLIGDAQAQAASTAADVLSR